MKEVKTMPDKEARRWRGFFSILLDPEPPVGVTPRKAIWKKNKATLWYYPPAQKKYRVPLLLIYSLVNEAFILDLAPGHSLIETFVNEGFDVYLLDFGTPGYEDKDITLDDYIVDYIQKGVQRVLRHSGASEVTLSGYCLGGTLTAMYAAIADEPIKNLILSVTPIDFTATPIFDKWAKAAREGKIDFNRMIDVFGIIPAKFMEAGMRLVASPIYYSPYLSLLNRAYDDEYVAYWRRFNKWAKGHVPFVGATLKQLTHALGKENQLINGGLIIRGKKVDLANIKANLLIVSTEGDRLVPKELVRPIMDLVTSRDKAFRLLQGGHATFTVKDGLPEYLADWLPERSEPMIIE
jgi:polyhydroxyalkanoate synthase subunit PhaC